MKIRSRPSGERILRELIARLNLAVQGTHDIRNSFFGNKDQIAEEVEEHIQGVLTILNAALGAQSK